MARKKKEETVENQEILEPTPLEEVVLESVETPATEDELSPAPAPDEAAEAAEPVEATQPEAEPVEPTAPAESGDTAADAPAIPSEEIGEEAEPVVTPPEETGESAPELIEPDKPTEDDGKTHVSLSLPLEPFKVNYGSIDRLKAATRSKQTLLKKALATDSLEIQIEGDSLVFPWFTIQEESKNAEEVDAYTKLVLALAKKALTQTRVSSEEKLNPDERLGMRLYLINLGFIGDEYKSARAILMRNFSGSSAAFLSSTPLSLRITMSFW